MALNKIFYRTDNILESSSINSNLQQVLKTTELTDTTDSNGKG
jgi:hypothetical protein